MTRELLGFYNESYGFGLEGLTNWANISMDNLLIPLFLMVFYGLTIYIFSRTEWKLSSGILFSSVLFFFIGMIAQTFTQFNQMVIFIFFVGIIMGIVLGFIENAR